MKYMLKKTDGVAVFKIGGSAMNETISLPTDLLIPSEVLSGEPFKVGIQFVQWASTNATEQIVIKRNGITVLALMGQGNFDLAGNGGCLDLQEANGDLEITGTGWVYIHLRKLSGYKSKIEGHTFGAYDDITKVGE